MQIFQITGAASPRIHVSETYNVFMKRFMSVCICCLVGTAAAMGPGGSSGTGGSSSSTGGSTSSTGRSVLQPEVGISAIQVYNQGVDLMHAKKFTAAQVKFEPELCYCRLKTMRFRSGQNSFQALLETSARTP